MNKLFIISLLIFCFFVTNAQKNILSRKISITITNLSLKKTLITIGQKADVKFSYNSEIINGDSIISIKIEKKSVKKCLNKIFKNSLKYKVAGNHIILLKKKKKSQTKQINEIKQKRKKKYIISGTIRDSKTSNGIEHVSIYDIDGKYSTITNKSGYYLLTVESGDKFRGLNYSKQGYHDTVIVVNAKKQNIINLSLIRKIYIVESIEQKKIELQIPKLEDILIHETTKINAKNLEHINSKRFFHISLLPRIGKNFGSNGIMVNFLSLNIIAGYAKGVSGVEIGSLLNIISENVTGVQISGFANIVGKEMTGMQIAGTININTGNVRGIQLSGVNNTTTGTVSGVQLAGVSNIIIGEMKGVQIAHFNNFITKNVTGAQLAITNIALGDIKFFQIAGLFNYAKINSGIQIAGILNYAEENKKLQIGLINISDTASGISLGLYNHVKKGYRAFEISSDEMFMNNLTFKSGSNQFYNIYNIGTKFFKKSIFSAGLGFGTKIKLGKRININQDITSNIVFMSNPEKNKINIHNRLSITLDFKISKRLSIFGGSCLNVVNSGAGRLSEDFISDFASKIIYEKEINKITTTMSVSVISGIRF